MNRKISSVLKHWLFLFYALVPFVSAVAFQAVHAGEVEILEVHVREGKGGAYSFDVTLRHDDKGWEHYADRWDVLAPDGTVLGGRILHHPHVDEQPFTRSLSGVEVPQLIRTVKIRAHDKVHGYSGVVYELRLPDR